jgi:hypothetical protein
MTKRLMIFIAIILSCILSFSQVSPNLGVLVENGIIIPQSSYSPFFIVRERFTPQKKDIIEFEKNLKLEFDSLYKKSSTEEDNKLTYENIKSYKRQYFGYLKNNHRILFVSFILPRNDSWKYQVSIVEGGGSNYFQIAYDMFLHKNLRLSVNASE